MWLVVDDAIVGVVVGDFLAAPGAATALWNFLFAVLQRERGNVIILSVDVSLVVAFKIAWSATNTL